MADTWRDRLAESLPHMRNDGYEDFTIVCQGKSFKVHGWVLALHSPVLARFCRGPFKEASDKVVTLEDDNKEDVAAIIDFCYTGECHLDHPFEVTIPVYLLADKYDMPHLEAYLLLEFKMELTRLRKDESVDFGRYVRMIARSIYAHPQITGEMRTLLAHNIVKHKLWTSGNLNLWYSVEFNGAMKPEVFSWDPTFSQDVAFAMQRREEFLEQRNIRMKKCYLMRCEYLAEEDEPATDLNQRLWNEHLCQSSIISSDGQFSMNQIRIMATRLGRLEEEHVKFRDLIDWPSSAGTRSPE